MYPCTSCGSTLQCDCAATSKPFCTTCLQDTTCDSKINAKCVFYHLNSATASELTTLGIGNNVDLEAILEEIDEKLGSFVALQTPLTAVDSTSIDFTTSGAGSHTLTGSVKISAAAENQLSIKSDGLYSSVKLVGIADGTCITFTKEVSDGQVIYIPHIDINCLATQICGICSPAACSSASNIQFS